MSWGAIGGAVVGGVMSGMNSDGGTQTQSKEPWGPAAPWLTQNLQTGQDLQGYYQNNLFNQQQQDAYGNLSAGTSYINQLIPGLIAQLSGQGGFDRQNPLARRQPLQLPAPTGFGQRNPVNMNQVNNPFFNGGIPAASLPQKPQVGGSGWDPSMAHLSYTDLYGAP